MEVLIKLKLKYRTVFPNTGGKTSARTGNSHGPTPKWSKKAYFPLSRRRAMC